MSTLSTLLDSYGDLANRYAELEAERDALKARVDELEAERDALKSCIERIRLSSKNIEEAAKYRRGNGARGEECAAHFILSVLDWAHKD